MLVDYDLGQHQSTERVDGMAAGQGRLAERVRALEQQVEAVERGQAAIAEHLERQSQILARLDPG